MTRACSPAGVLSPLSLARHPRWSPGSSRSPNLASRSPSSKIADRFESKPYGWDLAPSRVVLGWLVGNGKVAYSRAMLTQSCVPRPHPASATPGDINTSSWPHRRSTTRPSCQVQVVLHDLFDEGRRAAATQPNWLDLGKDKLAAKRDRTQCPRELSSRYPFVAQLSVVVAPTGPSRR